MYAFYKKPVKSRGGREMPVKAVPAPPLAPASMLHRNQDIEDNRCFKQANDPADQSRPFTYNLSDD
jgi:hypothetical protein